MRVPEELVCIYLFRQNPVFTSLHFKSPVHVVPPLSAAIHRSKLLFAIAIRHCPLLSAAFSAVHSFPLQSIPVHHSPSLSIAAHQCLPLSITVHRFPMLSCVHGYLNCHRNHCPVSSVQCPPLSAVSLSQSLSFFCQLHKIIF
jgi:hypothetical protein